MYVGAEGTLQVCHIESLGILFVYDQGPYNYFTTNDTCVGTE